MLSVYFGGETTRGKFVLMGIFVLFALVFSSWLASVQVQAVTVGVQSGNVFSYKVVSALNAHEMDGADNFTMTVTGVAGSNVSFQEAIKYLNGTTESYTGYIDLATGNNTGTTWLLFDANLAVGDPIYPGWPIWANETVSIDGRTMGHTVLNNAYVNVSNGPQGYLTADIYGDQASGVAYNATLSLTSGNTMSFSYYLTYTNAWTPVPEFSPLALAITISMLTVIAAVVYRKK